MPVQIRRVQLSTQGDGHTIDITDEVQAALTASGVRNGLAVAFVPGSTAGITTIEYEPGMVADLGAAFERLAPRHDPYEHNHGGDSNGHAHVRAAMLGPSISIPVIGGRLQLGTWQQVVLVDFDDRPRTRQVIVQIIGDREG